MSSEVIWIIWDLASCLSVVFTFKPKPLIDFCNRLVFFNGAESVQVSAHMKGTALLCESLASMQHEHRPGLITIRAKSPHLVSPLEHHEQEANILRGGIPHFKVSCHACCANVCACMSVCVCACVSSRARAESKEKRETSAVLFVYSLACAFFKDR